MPQLALVLIAGAGIYAGYRWLSGKLQQQLDEAARLMAEVQAAQEKERRAARGDGIKDLGVLEYDAEARVYRPSNGRRS